MQRSTRLRSQGQQLAIEDDKRWGEWWQHNH